MRVAIIGGAGNMGKWFSKFFLENGYEVVVSGKDKLKLEKLKEEIQVKVAKNNIEVLKDADIVIVSVLLKDFENVIREIAPHLKENQVVLDFTSVKEGPVEIMHKYIKNATVLGTHPLFGPGAADTKQNFALTPTNKKENEFAKKFGKWLGEKGFNVTIVPPRRHDELMSVVLGLSHFIGLVAGETWINFELSELKKVAPTSFQRILGLVENIIDNDPEFYANLQTSLPKVVCAEEKFIENAQELLKIVKNKDEKGFADKMRKLRNKMIKN